MRRLLAAGPTPQTVTWTIGFDVYFEELPGNANSIDEVAATFQEDLSSSAFVNAVKTNVEQAYVAESGGVSTFQVADVETSDLAIVIQTRKPTSAPTSAPTPLPTPVPTFIPSSTPTAVPTGVPTLLPSISPVPTQQPSPIPTLPPSPMPTLIPTSKPSPLPTSVPTPVPTPPPTLYFIREATDKIEIPVTFTSLRDAAMITGVPFVVFALAFLGLWRCLKRPTILVKAPATSLRERGILNHKEIEGESSAVGKAVSTGREESKNGDDETLTIFSTFSQSESTALGGSEGTKQQDRKHSTPLHAWAKHFHARALIENTPSRRRVLALQRKAEEVDRMMRMLQVTEESQKMSSLAHEQTRSSNLREDAEDSKSRKTSTNMSGLPNLPDRNMPVDERLKQLEEMAEGMARQHAILTEKLVTAESRQLAQQVCVSLFSCVTISLRVHSSYSDFFSHTFASYRRI